MTQVAAICQSLLKGEVLSIMDGFKKFACTNLPRELSRSIEQKFGVVISKTPTEFTSKFGHKGTYYRYRLNKTEYNQDGIKKMKEYVDSQKEPKALKWARNEPEQPQPEPPKPHFTQPNLFQ